MNAVVSNLILICAVMVVGFAALFWSQYQASTYQTQYSDTINSGVAQLQERISLEYINYNGSNLKLYMMNSGQTNVALSMLRVYNSTFTNSGNITSLYSFKTNLSLGTNTLNATVGQREGYVLKTIALAPGSYTVVITTGRSSTFVYTLKA